MSGTHEQNIWAVTFLQEVLTTSGGVKPLRTFTWFIYPASARRMVRPTTRPTISASRGQEKRRTSHLEFG